MTIEVVRRRNLNLLDEIESFGPYDDLPLIPAQVDVQIHVSLNDRVQPFYFAGTHDMVLATLSGKGRVVFRNSSVLYSQIAVGDFIYIPARTPHRIIPQDDMLMIRYKPLNPGLEAVMWFCERCEAEVWRYEYDADSEIPQAQWLLACERLNADANLRSCKECGTVSNQVDLGEFRWNEIADALAAEHRPA